jgi:hypothetical protein
MKIILFMFLGLGFIPGLLFSSDENSVAFQSLESVTETGAPVFNEIGFYPGKNKDIWIMRQSHHGLAPSESQWDRLSIVVDKTKGTASFYQLQSGPIQDLTLAQVIQFAQPLKARCFACHSNGPRAIRINLDSTDVTPSIVKQARVAFWNLRIKTYGKLKSQEGVHFIEGVPFKSPLEILSRPMPLKSCVDCHSENGIRNQLTLEQIGTVNFMVKNGFMPPFPFKITAEDARILNRLVR